MRFLAIVLTSVSSLLMSSLASAIVIDTSSTDMSKTLQNAQDENQTDWIAREQSAQVRIPISITNYDRVSVRGTNNKVTEKSVAMRPVVKTLRARLDRTNHFHLKDYHVETIPLRWIRNTNELTLKVNIFKKFGEYQQLEENMASMTLTGKLVGSNKLFVFHGAAKIKVDNKEGQPETEIIAGYGNVNDSSPVAKTTTKGSTL